MSVVICPSCNVGTVEVVVQSFVTYRDGVQVETSAPDLGDFFVSASCTDYDECRVALVQEPGEGRLRHAFLTSDGDPTPQDDALLAAWISAAYRAIGHEHPEWAVTFAEDGSMTCTECGETAPAADDTLTINPVAELVKAHEVVGIPLPGPDDLLLVVAPLDRRGTER